MRIYIIVLLAIAAAFVVFPQKTLACTCSLPAMGLSVKEQVKRAKKGSDAVFAGKVLELKEYAFYFTVRIEVKSKWKGIKNPEVTISTGKGGSCGYPFEIGVTYLIYAAGPDDKHLSTSICLRTRPLSASDEDLKELNKKR